MSGLQLQLVTEYEYVFTHMREAQPLLLFGVLIDIISFGEE